MAERRCSCKKVHWLAVGSSVAPTPPPPPLHALPHHSEKVGRVGIYLSTLKQRACREERQEDTMLVDPLSSGCFQPCAWTPHMTGCPHPWNTPLGEGQSVSSVAQSCPILCDPMSSPGLPVHHQLPELAQTHVHHISDAIQPSHPLSSPSPPAFNPSQHQGLFQCESFLHIRWPKYWRGAALET